MDFSEDTRARMEIAALTEPGHPVTGQLIRAIGPADTLALARNPDAPIPAAVDPLAGVRWRQTAAAWQAEGLGDRMARFTEGYGLRVLTPASAGWPASLADLGGRAPIVLWAKGNPELLTSSLSSRVTITGARAATGYGIQVAGELASSLAEQPRILISGGGYGIDAAVHRAALATRPASTIAVLAGGLDRAYPAAHSDLFQQIADGGGVQISEAPPEALLTKGRFTARARLLAALGGVTVIPEAGWRSGSLLVAARAVELGRPVGAIPGPVTSAASAGCHRLLREGLAEVVTHAGDVRELLEPTPFPLAPAYQQVARRAAPDASRAAHRTAL